MRLLFRTLLFTVLFPGTVTVGLPWGIGQWSGLPLDPPPGLGQLAGLGLIVAGVALYLWCARDFAVRGRGTPAP